MSSGNPQATERVALITGTKWCQSCCGWSNAALGTMRQMRGRYGPVKRWVCGSCAARSAAAKALARAKASGIDEKGPSVSRQGADSRCEVQPLAEALKPGTDQLAPAAS